MDIVEIPQQTNESKQDSQGGFQFLMLSEDLLKLICAACREQSRKMTTQTKRSGTAPTAILVFPI